MNERQLVSSARDASEKYESLHGLDVDSLEVSSERCARVVIDPRDYTPMEPLRE